MRKSVNYVAQEKEHIKTNALCQDKTVSVYRNVADVIALADGTGKETCIWKSVNYAVQGKGHIKTNTPCQDKTISVNRNGVSVIALADGAGSAKLSHFGAECVVSSISEYISDNFDSIIQNDDGAKIKEEILSHLQKNLKEKAKELQCEIKDLASTLLVAAVKGNVFIIIHIGDGVIGYFKNNELKVASSPENGEFANTTVFVVSKDAISTMKIFKADINGVCGFVLMSDGTAESFYNKNEKRLAPIVVNLLKFNAVLPHKKIKNIICDCFDNLIINKTPDDCSIAILSRKVYGSSSFFDLKFEEKCQFLEIDFKDKKSEKFVERCEEYLMIERIKDKNFLSFLKKIVLFCVYLKYFLRLKSVGVI